MASILWQSSTGSSYKMYLPTTTSSSVTLRYILRYSYDEFAARINELCDVDISHSQFIMHVDYENIVSDETKASLNAMDYYTPSESLDGTTWTSGNMEIRWSLNSGTVYTLYGSLYINDEFITYICTVLTRNQFGYALLRSPFIYDTTDDALILVPSDLNFITVSGTSYIFMENVESATLSINDANSIKVNNANPKKNPSDSNDPYGYGGSSGGNSSGGTGGNGTLDGSSDSIDFPALPTLSASSTGFITLFTPSNAQLNELADYMWNNDLFDLDTWKKVFDNPMDAIIGLSIVPVEVPSGGAIDVTVGNIITTVAMTRATSQFVEVDCGTINVQEYWGAYLDYSPYTKADLYLPYCGVHPINIDDIMGKAVHIKYHVDILSGSCVCYVKCGDSVLYSFIGQCSSSIPVTGSDMTQVINGALNIAGQGALFVASGGMSAPITASTVVNGINSTASNVMNMKPQVERSGSLSGTGGMMAIQKPYLVVTRPRQCLPLNQNQYTGYPSYITRTISTLSGFTSFMDVHLTNIAATDNEKNEIMQLLKEGVIL